jgi:sugar lactone lactonase YvrE
MLLKSIIAAAATAAPNATRAQDPRSSVFLLTNHTADAMTFLEEATANELTIAPSPWGIALGPNDRAYVSSAQYLTIVDTVRREVIDQIPFRTLIEIAGYGEYRSGGMGIAATPDGKWVAVGIHMNGANGLVELYDVAAGAFVATVPVGVRPFDVIASPDSSTVYSIDHDSFTITALDLATQTTTTLDAAPLGYGEFDKPHYAAVRSDGILLLPYVGRLLWMLDPIAGTSASLPMTAGTHQHGITLSDDESTAYIVGTGPAGPAPGPPCLTILDLATGQEQILELELPHEQVALTADGSTAILTGGYTFANGGWNGITLIDLASGEMSTQQLPGRPLAIVRLS